MLWRATPPDEQRPTAVPPAEHGRLLFGVCDDEVSRPLLSRPAAKEGLRVRLSVEAMNAALGDLKRLRYQTRVASAYEAFLVAKWLEGSGGATSAAPYGGVNEAVEALFDMLPSANLGRLHPFRYDWKAAHDSGRKTVWNNNSRVGARMSQRLFPNGLIASGLVSNAANLLEGMLPLENEVPRKPSWQSLAVLVLRDYDFSPGASWSDAQSLLCQHLNLSASELDSIASDRALGVSLVGSVEWSLETLEEALVPQQAVVVQSVPEDHSIAQAPGSPALSVVVDSRVERMLRLGVTAYSSVLLVGPPGTGKGTLLRWLFSEVNADPARFGLDTAQRPTPLWRTPDESWTTFDLIGGLAPDEEGHLTWSPGALLNAIAENRWLVLDETNRADMDKIMGPLLTWLSGQDVEVGRTKAHGGLPVRLRWSTAPSSGLVESDEEVSYSAGRDWRLIGTYNPQDAQRVFRFGQALSRRFVIVPIPALLPGQFDQLLATSYPSLSAFSAQIISGLYGAHLSDPQTTLGPAVFLGLARYVLTGLAGDAGAPPADEPEDETRSSHVVELLA
jgi:MoxR-like ATPase